MVYYERDFTIFYICIAYNQLLLADKKRANKIGNLFFVDNFYKNITHFVLVSKVHQQFKSSRNKSDSKLIFEKIIYPLLLQCDHQEVTGSQTEKQSSKTCNVAVLLELSFIAVYHRKHKCF